MQSLTTEFEAANRLRTNQLILEFVLLWYLLEVSVDTAERNHKRYLKDKKRARQQELKRENTSRKRQAICRPGW